MNKVIYATIILYLITIIFNWDYLQIGVGSNFSFVKLIILISLIIFLVIYIYLEKNISVFTPEKIFLLLYVGMVFPGILFMSSGANSDIITVVNFLSLCMFMLGYYLIRHFGVNKPVSNKDLLKSRIFNNELERRIVIQVITIVSIFSITIYLISGNFNRSGALLFFLDLFSDEQSFEATRVAQYRQEVYYSGAISGIRNVIGNYISILILPIISIFFLIEGKKRENNYMYSYGIILIVVSLVFSIGTGSRLMTLKVLLYFFVVLSFIYNFDFAKIVRVGFISLLMLILTTSILGRGLNSGDSFGEKVSINTAKALQRVFFVKGDATLLVYDYYPEIEDFELGATIFNTLLGSAGNSESLARKMYNYKYGSLGTAGPQTFGEFYANFGYVGQIFISLLLGATIAIIFLITLKKRRWSSFEIALFGYMYLTLGYMGYSDAASFKTSGFHILLLIYFLYNLFKIIFTKKSAI